MILLYDPLMILLYGTASRSSVPVVLVVVDAKAWRASVSGPVVLNDIDVLPEARRVVMLGPCGPHCRTFEGTAGLGARSCGP